ncbi:hypothetical protein DFR33_106264 [Bradymonas sediminis]|nr:hypothetical protein DFR33_106264 [Bradymonas sediminis]
MLKLAVSLLSNRGEALRVETRMGFSAGFRPLTPPAPPFVSPFGREASPREGDPIPPLDPIGA